MPTATDPKSVSLSQDEQRIYDLVCCRLLSAWHQDHVWSVTTVITAVGPDRFHTVGTAILEPCWKVLDIPSRKQRKAPPQKGSDEDESQETNE